MTDAQPTSDTARLFELASREQKWAFDAMARSFDSGVDHYHKTMVLAAAMLGVVVPLLARTPGVANHAWLRWGGYWLVGTIAVGVLWILASKIILIVALRAVGRFYAALASGAPVDAALGSGAARYLKPTERTFQWPVGLPVAGDAVFYGLFVAALVCISRSLL
jgi:hypothetical protein